MKCKMSRSSVKILVRARRTLSWFDLIGRLLHRPQIKGLQILCATERAVLVSCSVFDADLNARA